MKGKFLEYAIVHELNYYGTKYDDVIKNGIEK
jgi:guanylate kinase